MEARTENGRLLRMKIIRVENAPVSLRRIAAGSNANVRSFSANLARPFLRSYAAA